MAKHYPPFHFIATRKRKETANFRRNSFDEKSKEKGEEKNEKAKADSGEPKSTR